jgi:hypothetical protein
MIIDQIDHQMHLHLLLVVSAIRAEEEVPPCRKQLNLKLKVRLSHHAGGHDQTQKC